MNNGEEAQNNEDQWLEGKTEILRYLEWGCLAYLALAILLCFWLGNGQVLLGITVGGFIALINFRIWQWLGKKIIQKNQRRRSLLAVQMSGKVLLPFFLIAMALWVFKINPLGLILGISAWVASIFGLTIWATMRIIIPRKQK